MPAQPELIAHGDDLPAGSRRIGWRAPAVIALAILLAITGFLVRQRTDLAAAGFTRIGTVDGVTFWGRLEDRSTQPFLELRTTGQLGGICNTDEHYLRGFISCIGERPGGGYLVVAYVDPGEGATLVTNEGDRLSAIRIRHERPMDILRAPPGWSHDLAVLADPDQELGQVVAVRLPPK